MDKRTQTKRIISNRLQWGRSYWASLGSYLYKIVFLDNIWMERRAKTHQFDVDGSSQTYKLNMDHGS